MFNAIRVINTETGTYKLRTTIVPSAERAHELVTEWWADRTVVAVLVLIGELEEDDHTVDARYERPWMDRARLPEEYPPTRLPPKSVDDRRSTTTTPLPAPEPSGAPLNVCACCYDSKPETRLPEDDGTPSGRLDALLCPACGRFIGGKRRNIYTLYMKYQSTLSAEHQQKHKPWSPR